MQKNFPQIPIYVYIRIWGEINFLYVGIRISGEIEFFVYMSIRIWAKN